MARKVADEFVSRAAAGLFLFHEVLQKVGYHFAQPERAFVLNDLPDDASVQSFEAEMVRMPLLAARWCRRIQSVDFSQADEQFTDSQSPLAGLGWNTPLIIQSLKTAREHWRKHCDRSEEDRRFLEKVRLTPESPCSPLLFTGGCASNNECKGFALPSSRFDDTLYNDGAGDRCFGDEIAGGFSCLGFPVLKARPQTLKLVHSLYGKPDYAFLSMHLPKSLPSA